MCGCGTERFVLVVGLTILGLGLDSGILEVLSNLNDFVIFQMSSGE